MIFKDLKSKLKCSNIIFRLTSTWLILNLIDMLRYGTDINLSFAQTISFPIIIILFIAIFLLLSLTKFFAKNDSFDYYIALGFLIIDSVIWLQTFNSVFFILSLILIFLLFYKFKPENFNLKKYLNNKKSLIYFLTIGILIMLGSTLTISILRYKTFNSPNFDLGIIGQNFYYLKKLGLPLSTCERDILLSHLQIHISPIFYLLLPIYLLFPNVITLQIMNAILVESAIIPIYLLTKKHNFSKYLTIITCLVYSLYAPAICSTFFDLHENNFLIPLLLWLFYFYEQDNKIFYFITMILTLLIKEDAAIYLVIFGIYTIFDNKKSLGIKTILISIIYFITATTILSKYGEGVMSDRYNNLMYDSGLLSIIKTILINPGLFISELTNSNSDLPLKIKYLFQLLLPLGFIPFASKRWKNYILLTPLLLTLMSTYIYLYDINFHYSCGISAFLFYLFIINIKDLKNENYLLLCLISSILIFSAYVYPSIKSYTYNYLENKHIYKEIEKHLQNIPNNASVSASTFYLTHLTNRDTLYEVYYHNNATDIDYVVLDARYDDYSEFYNFYLNNNYNEILNVKNEIIILKKSPSEDS